MFVWGKGDERPVFKNSKFWFITTTKEWCSASSVLPPRDHGWKGQSISTFSFSKASIKIMGFLSPLIFLRFLRVLRGKEFSSLSPQNWEVDSITLLVGNFQVSSSWHCSSICVSYGTEGLAGCTYGWKVVRNLPSAPSSHPLWGFCGITWVFLTFVTTVSTRKQACLPPVVSYSAHLLGSVETGSANSCAQSCLASFMSVSSGKKQEFHYLPGKVSISSVSLIENTYQWW